MEYKKQVGLFFGSFDPFHIGHLLCIADVYNKTNIEKVLIIPAFQNPWKNTSSDWSVRYDTCEAMSKDFIEIGFVEVSPIEAFMKPQYTYQVLEHFKKNTDTEYYIIGGTDIANEIIKWKEGKWIIDNFKFIEIDRLGVTDKNVNGINISSTEIRNMIKHGINPMPYINLETLQIINKSKIYDSEHS